MARSRFSRSSLTYVRSCYQETTTGPDYLEGVDSDLLDLWREANYFTHQLSLPPPRPEMPPGRGRVMIEASTSLFDRLGLLAAGFSSDTDCSRDLFSPRESLESALTRSASASGRRSS